MSAEPVTAAFEQYRSLWMPWVYLGAACLIIQTIAIVGVFVLLWRRS